MMIEDHDAGPQNAAAHEVHVVGSAQIREVRLALVVAGERIPPGGQAVELVPRGVERTLDPAGVGETTGPRLTLLDGGPTALARRHEPGSGIRRSRGAARAQIALVDQNDAALCLGRRYSRPGAGRPAPDDQHVCRDVERLRTSAGGDHPAVPPRFDEPGTATAPVEPCRAIMSHPRAVGDGA